MTTTALEPLLTVRDVVDVLRVSRATVYRLVDRGELSPVSVGRSARFEPGEIRRFLAERRGR